MICNNFLSLTYTEFITNEFWNVHSNKLWNRTGLHHCVIWKILEVMNYSYIYHPLWLHLGVRNFLDIQREEQVFGLYNWLVHPVPRSMHSKVFKPSSPPFSPCRHLWVANKQCVCVCVCVCVHAKSLQLCLILCDPMDCSLPGCSVHEILQARILEWVVTPFSRGMTFGQKSFSPWKVHKLHKHSIIKPRAQVYPCGWVLWSCKPLFHFPWDCLKELWQIRMYFWAYFKAVTVL